MDLLELDFRVPAPALGSNTETSALAISSKAASSAKHPIELSVVIPSYNSAECLPILYTRLTSSIQKITNRYEIVFVDDSSKDNSWEMLKGLVSQGQNVRAFLLSKNFGQHAAISAGLSVCRGEWAVVMDCDLQDPPEDVNRLWEKAQEGFDIVMAKRIGKRQTAFRRIAASVYFRILAFFSLANVDGDCGTFSIISRPVIDSYLKFADINRHYLMILQWLGFKRDFIFYEHANRAIGDSSYSTTRLIKHALQGIFFQTTVLLQLIIAVGVATSVLGAFLAANVVWGYLVHSALPGWTSVVVIELLLGGLILLSLGVVGLYIGQIFDQVKGRPLFVFSKELVSSDQIGSE